MPTTYSDQFFVIDPYNGLPLGTAKSVLNYDMVDTDDNGFIAPAGGDTVNGLDVTSVWENDTITVNMGGSVVTITGVTFYVTGGPAVFTPTDGTILSTATFISSTGVTTSTQVPVGDFGPPCFLTGTLIAADKGDVAVEDLMVGDMVKTKDHGNQPVRWIGKSKVCATGRFAPVVFAPGSIGNAKTLRVSPQHRVLVSGWQSQLFFGRDDVLVSAKHLVDGVNIVQEPAKTVVYFHLLFDRHEVIRSDGTYSESFFPGDQILLQDARVRAELLELFPGLGTPESKKFTKTARRTIKAKEASVLVPAA